MTKPTLAVFVDVQNIYYTTKQAFGGAFNYRGFWQNLEQKYDIKFAFAYAIDSQNDGQHKFQKALRHIGFDVKLKPYIQRSDGSAKGDWDVGITIDVMQYASQVDNVMLLSGDGDFDRLMLHIRHAFEVKTFVVAVEQLTADGLIRSCDQFSPITQHDLI